MGGGLTIQLITQVKTTFNGKQEFSDLIHILSRIKREECDNFLFIQLIEK